ncbi:MAG TPA: AtpZ/AtpI family protein [Myxococcales bacterium]|nr:AtpZ/AtpI family protein [Myxococcales bacterium]
MADERSDGPGQRKDRDEATRNAFRYMDVGWTMLASVSAGLLGGFLLDRWLHTGPWLLVTGALLGIGTGLYELVLVALKTDAKKKDP